MEVGTQKILARCRSLTSTSKKTNQANTDQPTKPVRKIGEKVYILRFFYLTLKLLVRNRYKL